MKKLIDSFKTYEHVLSENTVMDNFRSIINKGKKFAKPEMKSCLDEFEEKLVKFHNEKKDQECTAKNAQTHQQKMSSLENLVVGKNDDESAESEITHNDEENAESEVIHNDEENAESKITHNDEENAESEITHNDEENAEAEIVEDSGVPNSLTDGSSQMRHSSNDVTTTTVDDIAIDSHASSEVTELEPHDAEVQSPNIHQRGASKVKAKRTVMKGEKSNLSAAPRRVTRSQRR